MNINTLILLLTNILANFTSLNKNLKNSVMHELADNYMQTVLLGTQVAESVLQRVVGEDANKVNSRAAYA